MLVEETISALAMADEREEVVDDDSGRAVVGVDMMAMHVLSCAALRGFCSVWGVKIGLLHLSASHPEPLWLCLHVPCAELVCVVLWRP